MDLQQMGRLAEYVAAKNFKAVADAFNQSPQVNPFGMRCVLDDPQRPRVLLDPVTSIHRGGVGGGAVNGAVIAGMFDLAIGLLGVPYWTEGMAPTATLNIQYLRPAVSEGVKVIAERGEVTSSRIFGSAVLRGRDGVVYAQAQGSLGRGRVLRV